MYVIEREIPGAGSLSPAELEGISQLSCAVINDLGAEKIKWLHSYVANDKVFCVYMASSESLVKEHASQGGFPANLITEVGSIIDPSTAN
ncbi:MAG: DUF4242 domain-containing protein [Bacteroidia bacterium]|nr:DUF4242 domain-containing protein [Bacteroidia bacterium]